MSEKNSLPTDCPVTACELVQYILSKQRMLRSMIVLWDSLNALNQQVSPWASQMGGENAHYDPRSYKKFRRQIRRVRKFIDTIPLSNDDVAQSVKHIAVLLDGAVNYLALPDKFQLLLVKMTVEALNTLCNALSAMACELSGICAKLVVRDVDAFLRYCSCTKGIWDRSGNFPIPFTVTPVTTVLELKAGIAISELMLHIVPLQELLGQWSCAQRVSERYLAQAVDTYLSKTEQKLTNLIKLPVGSAMPFDTTIVLSMLNSIRQRWNKDRKHNGNQPLVDQVFPDVDRIFQTFKLAISRFSNMSVLMNKTLQKLL